MMAASGCRVSLLLLVELFFGTAQLGPSNAIANGISKDLKNILTRLVQIKVSEKLPTKNLKICNLPALIYHTSFCHSPPALLHKVQKFTS
jgi:hypothetical protein